MCYEPILASNSILVLYLTVIQIVTRISLARDGLVFCDGKDRQFWWIWQGLRGRKNKKFHKSFAIFLKSTTFAPSNIKSLSKEKYYVKSRC